MIGGSRGEGLKESGAGKGTEDATECAETLRHAERHALSVFGNRFGDERIHGGIGEGGAERVERHDDNHGEDGISKRGDEETDAHQEDARNREAHFTEFAGELANHQALHNGGDDADFREQRADAERIQANTVFAEESERGFHIREREDVQKENDEQKGETFVGKDLLEVSGGEIVRIDRTLGVMQRFGQLEIGPNEIAAGHDGRDYRGKAIAIFSEQAAHRRAKDEAETERRANESHAFRAIFRSGRVSDKGLRGGKRGTGQYSGEGARDK